MDPSDPGYYEQPNYFTSPKVKAQNFDLGNGDPDWLNTFAQGQQGTRQNASSLNSEGRILQSQADTAAQRGGPQASYAVSNNTLQGAQNTLKNAQAQGQTQGDVAGRLVQFAQGPQGPSAAQAQLQKGTDAALNAQLAMARSGSGFGQNAAAMNAASQNAASTIAGAANDSATLKAQEDQAYKQQQMAALQGAANIYQQQQAGTLAQAQQQQAIAAQQGGQSEFNLNAALQERQQNDALQMGLANSGIQAQNMAMGQDLAAQGLTLQGQQAQLQGHMAQEQANAQLYGSDVDAYKAELQNQVDNRNLDQQFGRDIVGGVGSAITAIGGLAMLSDVRAKTDIKPTSVVNRYDDDSSDTGRAYRSYETDQSDDLLDTYSALKKRDEQAQRQEVGRAFQTAGQSFSGFSKPLTPRR